VVIVQLRPIPPQDPDRRPQTDPGSQSRTLCRFREYCETPDLPFLPRPPPPACSIPHPALPCRAVPYTHVLLLYSSTDAGLQVSYYRPGYPDSLARDNAYVFTPEQIGAPRDFLLYTNYANGTTFVYPVSPYCTCYYTSHVRTGNCQLTRPSPARHR
jgi:hypothetical protein